VPTEQDFADARSALAANHSTGRVNVGRGVRIPYSVRGESNYQSALKYLRRYADSNGRVPALLVRERDNRYDENAVAVMAYGRTVGYLSRDDAADLADDLDELADSDQFLACPACLVGGTADKPNIGVVVELREASER
jgi:HIRAN domain